MNALESVSQSGMRVTGMPGREIYLCEPDPSHLSCVTTWNRTEYLSATGAASRVHVVPHEDSHA